MVSSKLDGFRYRREWFSGIELRNLELRAEKCINIILDSKLDLKTIKNHKVLLFVLIIILHILCR